ncbi:hypothetical protein BC628DRAFT_425288 [Trametes gibbosa]|nr:hypothetical protein BC628DRAFT_425288 [Trametes gibbosa]
MSPTVDPPPTALPAELHDRIVDFIHDDWRALVGCALTGTVGLPSPLVPCAEYHLSRTITLPISVSYNELLDFIKVFLPRSHLVSLIRSIYICGPPITPLEKPKAVFPALLDLAHLPHLRALALSHLSVELTARFTRFLCKLPALEELSFENLTPRVVLRGGYRAIPDVGPTEQEAVSFCTRLKSLRVVDPPSRAIQTDTGDRLQSPNDVLLQVLERGRDAGAVISLHTIKIHVADTAENNRRNRWMAALCRGNNNLQCIDLTLYERAGVKKTADAWDIESSDFLACAEQWPHSLTSLCIRYEPWSFHDPDTTSSETIDVFLDLLSSLFTRPYTSPTTQTTSPYVALQIYEVILKIPFDARANAETWTKHMRSLNPRARTSLKHVRITLESLKIPILGQSLSEQLSIIASPLENLRYGDMVERCGEVVREEFRVLGDHTVEVVIKS